jgi:hypothetical protein
VLAHQHRLGLAVALLLLEVGPHRGAPVVPDESRRVEPDAIPPLLQPPAQVHVIARLREDGIEPANLLQRPLVERHVAPGDVFGHTIVEHHVGRSARGHEHRGGDRRILRRQEVRPTDAREAARDQIAHKVIEPVFVRPAVRVRERDDLALRSGDARVARDRQSMVLLSDDPQVGIERGDLRRGVGRTVVHQDHFVVWII